MDEIFKVLPKLFVNKMIKLDELSYQSCGSVIKSCRMEQIKSTKGTNVCGRRKKEKYFELFWF